MIRLLILGLLCLGAGVIYGIRAVLEVGLRRRLQWEGMSGVAVIVKRWAFTSARTGSTHEVTYRYTLQGQNYQRTEGVHYRDYAALPEGTQVLVRYLPQHPSKGRIAWNNRVPHYVMGSLAFLGAGFLLGPFVVFIALLGGISFSW